MLSQIKIEIQRMPIEEALSQTYAVSNGKSPLEI